MDYIGAASTPEARQALTADPDAEARRIALNRAAADIMARASGSTRPTFLRTAVRYVEVAYRELERHGQEAGLKLLDAGQQELEAHVARLQDLLGAVLGPEGVAEVASRLDQVGFEVEPPATLAESGVVLGWVLRLSRPA